MKKILALITILLALGVVAYFYFEKEIPSKNVANIQHAIPSSFPIALESSDWQELFEKIDTFKYGATLNQQDWIIGTKVNLNYLEKLLENIPAGERFTGKANVLVAYGNAGNSQLGIHIAMQVNPQMTFAKLKNMVEIAELKFEEYTFQDNQLLTLIGFNDIDRATLTIKGGILLFSLQASSVEESLIALEERKYDWGSLTASFKSTDDARLYIKPEELNYLSSYFLKSSSYDLIDGLEKISGVTALQLNFFQEELSFNGYALPGSGTVLDTLRSTLPGDNSLVKSLPGNTAYYEMIALTGQEAINATELDYKTVLNIVDESLILFTLESFNAEIANRKGALLSLESQDFLLVLSAIDSSMKTYNATGPFPIYTANALAPIFNQLLLSPNYFKGELFISKVNDVLVCSETLAVIEQYIFAQEEMKVLRTNEAFINFKAPMSTKCLLDMYADLSLIQGYLNEVTTENTWQGSITKINAQYIPIGNQIYCNGKLVFGSSESKVSKALWTASLDSPSVIKPQIVKNHNDNTLEVLCQDAANQLYLINTSGEQEWKVQLAGRVIGEIQQIDYYKNKKLQYVFNTPTKIYIVDRNGDFVDGFPIDLPANATNGMLLVNYDNSGTYRYLVACENGNIYGYEQNGSPLTGWSPKKDVGQVVRMIQYMVKDNKDYLYFNNTDGKFFALNRKGEDRFAPVNTGNTHNSFTFDEQIFGGGDKGIVYEIDILGNLKTKTILDSSFVHCLVQASIVQNSQAYAFAAGSTFKFQQSQWKNFSSFTTESAIRKIESLINKNKLWFVLYTSNQVYLIDELGTLHPDFPLSTKTDIRLANFIQGKDRIILYNDIKGKLIAKEIAW